MTVRELCEIYGGSHESTWTVACRCRTLSELVNQIRDEDAMGLRAYADELARGGGGYPADALYAAAVAIEARKETEA